MSAFYSRLASVAAAGVAFAAVGAGGLSVSAVAPTYSTAIVGAYGGEPSLVSDNQGRLYDATPSGGMVSYRSDDHGKTWKKLTIPDSSSGDNCLGVDESTAIYQCNLAGGQGVAPLQADEWKTVDQGKTWTHGAGALPQCGTSCSAFGVDRDWTAASIQKGASSDTAEVVLMYHDFYGASQIWVNISEDGGKTFGPAVGVLETPGAGGIPGSVIAEGFTFCNTVPAGVGIVPKSRPHEGRIYVGWIASDAVQDASGCNYTMLQSFHTLWVSWSDDEGATWTAQQAFDAGVGHDASSPFTGFTLDDEGDPYFGSTINLNSNPATCASESSAGTVQADTSCEYDMYVVWSHDGGATWNDGGGLVPGSATTPYRVNPPSDTGTHFFPAIAAGRPGQVAVSYLKTDTIIPTDPFGKEDPGACAGPQTRGTLPTYPPKCVWRLYGAQSLNLGLPPNQATWTSTLITPTPMHTGDICNLGIACIPGTSNRHLLDFISEAIDPQGCAHIAYADDNTGDTTTTPPTPASPNGNHLVIGNETSGCLSPPRLNFVGVSASPGGGGSSTPAPSTGSVSPGSLDLPPTSPASPIGTAGVLLVTFAVFVGRAVFRRRA